jgi:hypothetical protein
MFDLEKSSEENFNILQERILKKDGCNSTDLFKLWASFLQAQKHAKLYDTQSTESEIEFVVE